jgi:transcriptional regulator with XRE-family HTH domain
VADRKKELRKKSALSPGEVFALRLSEVRNRRGWTQQQLSDRLTELRHPIHRVTLAKLEQGEMRSRNVPLEDVLAIALALGVAPLHLFVPFEPSRMLSVTPSAQLQPETARQWIRGRRFVDYSEHEGYGVGIAQGDRPGWMGDDLQQYRFYFSELPPEEVAAAMAEIEKTEAASLSAPARFLRERTREEEEDETERLLATGEIQSLKPVRRPPPPAPGKEES